ncbi:MAG: class I SAM-dependent methyltransferase [Acidobacteriia bacterium]|nr:class I SAM-dependent methyltransferase [Terriglobia bacterium]
MSDRHDAYRGIARHYDLQRMDWYAFTYGKRLQTLLTERGLAGSRILDAGCGTGSLAIALSKAGYTVTGVDLSEALLEVARAKDDRKAVRWVQGDLAELDLGETFDAITSVADVLNHLETLDEWERVLGRLALHLAPGGYLFFDAMTCHGLEHLDSYTIHDRENATLILGIIWEPPTRRSTLKLTSFVPADRPGLFERVSETITEWGQPVAAIFERLKRAGFAEIERLWGTSDEPEADERLTVLARRA